MSSSAIRRAAPANPIAATGVFPSSSNTALACVVPIPGKLAIEAKKFRVRAEGYVYTAVGTTTVKPQILAATAIPASNPLTIASWTALAAGAGVASPTTGCPWWAEAELIYDSYSGLMHGTYAQLVNNTFAALAAITGVLTGLNGSNVTVTQGVTPVVPADPIAYLAVGITYGAAGANNCYLSNFEVSF